MVSGQGQGRCRVGLGLGLIMGFGFLSDRAHATTTMATVEAVAPAPLDQPKASSISGKEDEDEPFLLPTQPLSPLSNPLATTPVTTDPRQSPQRLDPHAGAFPNTETLSVMDSSPGGPTEVSRLEQANGIPAPDFSISGILPEPSPGNAILGSTSAIDLADGSGLPTATGTDLDIDPAIIENSPVLQRWLEAIPDVATDIKYDPAFRPRLRAGYAFFPSNGQTSGFQVGVQDWFLGRTPLALSADYSENSPGDRASYGIDAQYYILPLGWYGNVAPVLGYRSLDTPTYSVSGFNVGFRIVLIPSRTGAADLSLTQTWVAPGTPDEVGLTTFSVGYAVTSQLRIATDIQTQNAPGRQDSRVGVLLEWLL
jgi:hypothetical protein